MSSSNYDGWAVGTTIVLVIAVTLVVFSMLPQMASNDLTAQMTPEVTEPPMASQQSSPLAYFRGAPERRPIGIAEGDGAARPFNWSRE